VAVTPALGVTWASACSCVGADDVESAGRADAIFAGTLTDTVTPNQSGSSMDPVTYSFAVSRVYKGDVATSQPVGSVISGASCGLELDGTGPFLVFASANEEGQPALKANLCGGTRPLGSGPDPALGPGYAAVRAVPVVAAAATHDGDSQPALLALGGALGLIAAGGLAFELRRRRAHLGSE
jgi:hypothetical protein